MKLKDLKRQLKELTELISSKESFSKEELFTWLTESVAFFSYLGVNEIIIKTFITSFSPSGNNSSLMRGMFDEPNHIGPFERDMKSFKYKLAKDFIGRTKIEDTYPLLMAFRTAEYLIEQKADEERLVSKSLVQAISDNKKLSNIASLLNDLQRGYENKDTDKLYTSSISLLEAVLNLEPTLKLKKNVSSKLRVLLSNEVTRGKFGVHKEFIVALDNSRILRNIKSVHKNIPIKYDSPFIFGLSFAYLVLVFIEIAMSTGSLDVA